MVQQKLDLRGHALTYGSTGWPVLPLKPRGKLPLTRHGAKDATTSTETIEAWWRRCPDANIGIAVPAGFLVVDIDSATAYASLEAEFGSLPETVHARTAKGWHFWFCTDAAVSNRVGIRDGIDTRAQGGYLVVPPSIHPAGPTYRWERELDRRHIAPAPDWVLQLAGSRPPPHAAPTGRRAEDSPNARAEEWRRRFLEPVAEGRRNQTLAQLAGLLFRNLPAEIAGELAWCWAKIKTTPQLSDSEIFRTLDSIAGRELQKRRSRA